MSSYYGTGYPYQQNTGPTGTHSFYQQDPGYQQAPGQNNQQQHSQQHPPQQQQPGTGYDSGYGRQPAPQPWNAQPQPGAPNFWNPATAAAAASFVMATAAGNNAAPGQAPAQNDAVVNFVQGAGSQFLESGKARFLPGLESAIISLRTYFAVDNGYVLRKMQRILFPFRSNQWKRVEAAVSQEQVHYALPHSDINAPDLYIPSMSLVTYVLLCGLCYGTAGKFNPEVLGNMTTKCMVTQLLEVAAMRLGFFLMQAKVSLLDLVSYTGYKYLGLCVNMLMGLILGLAGYGHRTYYITFLWTASAIAFFVLKTMANTIPVVTSATGPKRELMVLGFCLSQFATMWFLSQTKFLN